ncbi:thioredoxin family protein [Flavobacteriaceae bacterium F08102]|nr:thioredoxin family protein [Flavobacteriaceae bacterium F08102]
MSLAYSTMMELGAKAPDFTLLDTVSGKITSLAQLKSDTATVVVFICNHCPFIHHINSRLVEVAKTYQSKGIQFIAISSNDIEYTPEDAPEYMTQVAQKEGYTFPYLYDATQAVAKAYKAECTPDFFIFNGNLNCVYRGRFDETRPGIGEATGADLTNALDALLLGKKVSTDQKPSMGCNIKWK